VKFVEALVIAIRSLSANKLRSSLTMLGVIIGVGAVITLMSVGRGAQAEITSRFEEMGTNLLTIIGARGIPNSLTMGDAEALANSNLVPSVAKVAPQSQDSREVIAGSESITTTINGVTPDYQQVRNYTVASGLFISDKNMTERDMVAVLGSNAAEDLFGSGNPVGRVVKIEGRLFTVVGVLEAKGGAFMGRGIDDMLMMPITTFQSRLFPRRTATGEAMVQTINVQVASPELTDKAIQEIKAVLRERHRLLASDEDDFIISSQEEIISTVSEVTGIFTIVLGAIASISLLVSSIGIMNIMLVSVTERTREIGIRKAVGAKRRDILIQFMSEATMLSLTGGGIGIVGGWFLSSLISRLDIGGQTLQTLVSPDIIILAVSVSIIIGLASGIYPAMRAARLNPIDALHYG